MLKLKKFLWIILIINQIITMDSIPSFGNMIKKSTVAFIGFSSISQQNPIINPDYQDLFVRNLQNDNNDDFFQRNLQVTQKNSSINDTIINYSALNDLEFKINYGSIITNRTGMAVINKNKTLIPEFVLIENDGCNIINEDRYDNVKTSNIIFNNTNCSQSTIFLFEDKNYIREIYATDIANVLEANMILRNINDRAQIYNLEIRNLENNTLNIINKIKKNFNVGENGININFISNKNTTEIISAKNNNITIASIPNCENGYLNINNINNKRFHLCLSKKNNKTREVTMQTDIKNIIVPIIMKNGEIEEEEFRIYSNVKQIGSLNINQFFIKDVPVLFNKTIKFMAFDINVDNNQKGSQLRFCLLDDENSYKNLQMNFDENSCYAQKYSSINLNKILINMIKNNKINKLDNPSLNIEYTNINKLSEFLFNGTYYIDLNKLINFKDEGENIFLINNKAFQRNLQSLNNTTSILNNGVNYYPGNSLFTSGLIILSIAGFNILFNLIAKLFLACVKIPKITNNLEFSNSLTFGLYSTETNIKFLKFFNHLQIFFLGTLAIFNQYGTNITDFNGIKILSFYSLANGILRLLDFLINCCHKNKLECYNENDLIKLINNINNIQEELNNLQYDKKCRRSVSLFYQTHHVHLLNSVLENHTKNKSSNIPIQLSQIINTCIDLLIKKDSNKLEDNIDTNSQASNNKLIKTAENNIKKKEALIIQLLFIALQSSDPDMLGQPLIQQGDSISKKILKKISDEYGNKNNGLIEESLKNIVNGLIDSNYNGSILFTSFSNLLFEGTFAGLLLTSLSKF